MQRAWGSGCVGLGKVVEILPLPRTRTSSSYSPIFFSPTPNLTTPSPWRTNAENSSTFTSPASAAQPTASSRPRTTALFRSPSPRSTRTADSPARLRPTPSAASFAPWASPTTASTASPSVTATSRTSGAPADKRFAPMV